MRALLLLIHHCIGFAKQHESKGEKPTVVTPLPIKSIAMSQTKDGTPVLCIAYRMRLIAGIIGQGFGE